MKIMIITPYYHPHLGGLENYSSNLARGLLENGHEVILVTSHYEKELSKEEQVDGIRVIRLPISFTISNTPIGISWYWRLKKIIKLERPDIINAHGPVPYMSDVAVRAAGKVPVVTTYHAGSMIKGSPIADSLIRTYERFFLPQLLRKSRETIGIYPTFLKKIVRSPAKINNIPPSVNTTLFRKISGIQKRYDVVFAGRIDKSSSWKGLDVLLYATAHIVMSRPSFKLQVVGYGDAVNYYREMAVNLGIENNVTFVGAMLGEDLVKAYNSSKILVLPSKTESESFGIVIIEALACGVPVIGSRIGGIPSVIKNGKNGYLFRPGDSDELALKIASLLDDSAERQRFANYGSQMVSQKYTVSKCVDKTMRVFERVLTNSYYHKPTKSYVHNAPPEIVHVTSSYPPALGGLEKVVETLAREETDIKLNVRVITSNQGFQANYVDVNNVKRLKCFRIANTTIMPTLLWQLLKIPKNTLVHLHVAHAFSPETVWLASIIKRFPYIAHVHIDTPPSSIFGVLLKVYKPLLLKVVLRHASSVIVFSDEQKKKITEKYGLAESNVEIIHNGVSEEFFISKTRKLHKKPRLLFVGRLSSQKNLKLLLDALDGVSHKYITTIVGEGELRHELENYATKLRIKNLIFAGRLEGKSLLDSYKNADIFVLPSEREGMPLVLLEAMAAGLPIVATNVVGIQEIVKDGKNGLLVPLDDVEGFRQAIQKITTSTKKYEAMCRATQRAAKYHTWQKVASRFSHLYVRILKPRTHREITNGSSIFALMLPLLAIANLAYFLPGQWGSIITAAFFLSIPGYLLLRAITKEIQNSWVAVSMSVILSMLIIMLGGLLLNSLRIFGFQSPLSTSSIFSMLDVMTLFLLIVNRKARFSPNIDAIKNFTGKELVVVISASVLPLLALGGAIRLNNGASNILTLMTFGLIGIVFAIAFKLRTKKVYPYVILMTAMSILLSTSMRGWFISGHDIVHEFQVFQSTVGLGFWQVTTPQRDAYNACLSITILPTVLQNITHISGPYIYKIVFQLAYALTIPLLYFTAQRLTKSTRLSVLSVLVYMLMPTFLNDMPFLNRQEIAFAFFAAVIYTAFSKISVRAKTILTILFLSGILFSHYSTSYVTIALLGISWVLYRLSIYKHPDRKIEGIPLLNPLIIIMFIVLTGLWSVVITQTTSIPISRIYSASQHVDDISIPRLLRKAQDYIKKEDYAQSNDVRYGLFSFGDKDSQEVLNKSISDPRINAKYISQENLPVTSLGKVISHVIPVTTLNEFIRAFSTKALQIFLLVGVVSMAVRLRKKPSNNDQFLLILTVAGIVLLAMITLLPVVSQRYGATRLFQQILIFGSVPIVYGLLTLLSPFKKYKFAVSASLVIFLFLHLSGFIPQLVGGYPPQMALNNKGIYYDLYYQHNGERMATGWTSMHSKNTAIDTDSYGATRFEDYPFQKARINNIIRSRNEKNLLYQYYAPTNSGKYGGFISGNLIQFSVNDQRNQRNLLYVNPTSRLYGTVNQE